MTADHADEAIVCCDLVELVTDYLEGALPGPRRERFEAHLAVCPPCREYLEQIRRTIAVLGRMAPIAASEAERERLLKLFQGWRDQLAG